MRGRCLLVVGLALACATSSSASPAYAISPDDLPWDAIDQVLKEEAKVRSAEAASPTAEEPKPYDNTNVSTQDDGTAGRPEDLAPPAQRSDQKPQAPAAPTTEIADPSPPPASNANAAPPASPAPSVREANPEKPKVIANDDLIYLPLARYLQNGERQLASFNADDRLTLQQFYASRMGSTIWVTKTGYNEDARNLIAALKDADNWGLKASDYKIAEISPKGDGEFSYEDLTSAEVRLSLAALAYARDAHGDRITDPSSQLGTYLDRKPQLLDRRTVIDTLATAPDKGAYLRSLNPKHPQFELLRQKLLALRSQKSEAEAVKIPDGPKLMPGKSHPQIALIRKVLKVSSPTVKADGTPADDTYYDDGLARAVEDFKGKKGIEPVNPAITAAVRRELNRGDGISEAKLLANMEEWRWMPEDLGKLYVNVNIPEFTVRVFKNGEIVHEERIVSGRYESQTPMFSSPMRTIVLQPRWNVPESIKVRELLPGLRTGGDPLRRQGLVMQYNGRKVDAWSVDWSRSDIRNFEIYQPPGGSNALGVVKFLFPNKHSVYLHDTPAKNLFNERVRMFSHGCMRVRNPVQLAELLLKEDKGWDRNTVDDLITHGPEENEVTLSQPIPVHVTYFTAWVGKDRELQTFDDVYGHEKRVTLALQGRWNEIEKGDEKVLSPEDFNVAADGGGFSLFGFDDDPKHPNKKGGDLGKFLQQVFGGF